MSLTTAVDFLLQVVAQSGVGCVRFLVSLIMLLALPSLDLTADNGRLDIKCHPRTNEVVKQDCLSLYSAETRPFISPHFLVQITAILVIVLWSVIIVYNAKKLPKIKRTTVYSEKEHLCHEFWKKFYLHVCSEAAVIAISLAYLCYTQKMHLTENAFYCHLKNVTCSIEHQWDKENPITVIIGGMVLILVLSVWTICDAIGNKEEIIKDLVNSTTRNKEGKERLEINVQPLK